MLSFEKYVWNKENTESGKSWHERVINRNISLEEVALQTFEMHKLSKLCKLAPPGTPLGLLHCYSPPLPLNSVAFDDFDVIDLVA